MARKRRSQEKQNWYRIDLHLHTPGSNDYLEPDITPLNILRKAESCGLDIIAFTDHNSVGGIKALRTEIEQLEFLERLNRIEPEESQRLQEYRYLLSKILLLPGFELTAALGFHILGIFPPETTVRTLEHILLSLRVPPDLLDKGSTQVGGTVDVLTAYRIINEAGGLVIAAHANTNHGVAMQDFNFGGQTKIAYTQDPNLHALEVTDLETKRRRNTANFYNGSKPEYPRRMHCIQGSDAHRLNRDPSDKNRLGVGDRITEVQLPEVSFEALKGLFLSTDFSRSRPFRGTQTPFDHVIAARQQGPNIVQAFHPSITRKGGHLHALICDICAFANTNGGNIYVGVSADPKQSISGVARSLEAQQTIRAELEQKINPPLDIDIDEHVTHGKKVLQITVPIGDDPPYVIDEDKIFVRDESETNIAVRDEIVALVRRNLRYKGELNGAPPATPAVSSNPAVQVTTPEPNLPAPTKTLPTDISPEPKTGVEIVLHETRQGTNYYSLRDLRNGNIVHNVTRKSARKLWQYALTEHEKNSVDPKQVNWHGDIGLWKKYGKGGQSRYDLVQRDPDQTLHVYYGVTEDGLHGPWQSLIDRENGD